MDVELFLTPADVKDIFADVGRAPRPSRPGANAHAPLLPEVGKWVNDLWSKIETAIDDVTQRGKDQIGFWKNQISELIDDMRRQISEGTQQVLDQVEKMLFEACQRLQSKMLQLLPASAALFGKTANLSELSVQYQLSVSTTFVAALNWALQIAGGATISVSAKYGFA
jgi:hypothetical protein